MTVIKPSIKSVTAFAPATCSNVAVGFDILGFSFDKVGDTVTLTKRDDQKIVIEAIDAHDNFPFDIDKNTASIALKKLCQDLNLNQGFSLRIQKGIPLSSGMGGSAASAVAAVVALNGFLETPLSHHELIRYALCGEEVASGEGHFDNIVPCLWGGMTLIHSQYPLEVVQLPLPSIICVLIHPHLQVATKEARTILKETVTLKNYIFQSANLAGFIASLYRDDKELCKKSLTDILIEPQRAHFVPGFYDIKQAALDAGSLGVSFSGSGPSIFAFAASMIEAERMGEAMCAVLARQNISVDSWITALNQNGARITEIK